MTSPQTRNETFETITRALPDIKTSSGEILSAWQHDNYSEIAALCTVQNATVRRIAHDSRTRELHISTTAGFLILSIENDAADMLLAVYKQAEDEKATVSFTPTGGAASMTLTSGAHVVTVQVNPLDLFLL